MVVGPENLQRRKGCHQLHDGTGAHQRIGIDVLIDAGPIQRNGGHAHGVFILEGLERVILKLVRPEAISRETGIIVFGDHNGRGGNHGKGREGCQKRPSESRTCFFSTFRTPHTRGYHDRYPVSSYSPTIAHPAGLYYAEKLYMTLKNGSSVVVCIELL